jgi:phosphatidate phosphatase APP1
MDDFPERRSWLVGTPGELDPEIYGEVAPYGRSGWKPS